MGSRYTKKVPISLKLLNSIVLDDKNMKDKTDSIIIEPKKIHVLYLIGLSYELLRVW